MAPADKPEPPDAGVGVGEGVFVSVFGLEICEDVASDVDGEGDVVCATAACEDELELELVAGA